MTFWFLVLYVKVSIDCGGVNRAVCGCDKLWVTTCVINWPIGADRDCWFVGGNVALTRMVVSTMSIITLARQLGRDQVLTWWTICISFIRWGRTDRWIRWPTGFSTHNLRMTHWDLCLTAGVRVSVIDGKWQIYRNCFISCVLFVKTEMVYSSSYIC